MKTRIHPGEPFNEMPIVTIQCVVVLYQCSPEDSKSLESFAAFCRMHGDSAKRIALLIYDNSPSPQTANLSRWNCATVEYRHDATNGCLAPAYNQALALAQEQGIEWLLLLDQDTILNPDLFPALFAAVARSLPPDVCAIVPKLVQQKRVLSPQIVGRLRNLDCPAVFSGISARQVIAFNSAACMRVQALISIGGFSPEYRLEYLDHITFHRLQCAGGRILILDIVIQHNLSFLSVETEMGLDRYGKVLDAEWKFIRETGWGGGTLVHRLRLLKRTLHHFATLRNKAYAFKVLRAVVK